MTDVDRAVSYIRNFLKEHDILLDKVGKAVSSTFEALCVVYFAKCYKDVLGYNVAPIQTKDGYYRFNPSTRGFPENFSAFEVSNEKEKFYIFHNVAVAAQNDPSVLYTADVVVSRTMELEESIKWRNKRAYRKKYVPSRELITFAECKHMYAYSMLLAQFLGIVFEIKPDSLDAAKYTTIINERHIPPALLISLGTHIGAETAIASFKRRKFAIVVAARLFNSPDELFHQIVIPARNPSA